MKQKDCLNQMTIDKFLKEWADGDLDWTCDDPAPLREEMRTHLEALLSSENLQIDAWKRYAKLLGEELDSAVGMARIHGWRSTPDSIELGKKLRAELGIPEPNDQSTTGKQIAYKCHTCGNTLVYLNSPNVDESNWYCTYCKKQATCLIQ